LKQSLSSALIFLVLSTSISGCTTVLSVERNMQLINYSDGISKKEALTIARKAVINSSLDDYYKVWTASAYDRGDYFVVSLPSFALNHQECILVIEKERGEILAFWQAEGLDEITELIAPTRSIKEWREGVIGL